MSECYVGIKPCGCVVAAVSIDNTSKDTLANEVAEFIKQGLRVEMHDTAWVKEHFSCAPCKHTAAQGSMDLVGAAELRGK